MFRVVLHRPEIPPNTGNLMRLCVNTGARLHLIHPLGFDMTDARMRRAGLDYKERAVVEHHDDLEAFLADEVPPRVFAFTPRGEVLYSDVEYGPGDALLFGRESVGLPPEVVDHEAVTRRVRIPIAEGGRSLNLANAAAIVVYEAWRQHGFRPVA
jgi:tRNA (cytidine/uridine-2'-O-)-methyltransferase